MLKDREQKLYDFLMSVEDRKYVSTKEIIYSLDCYRAMKYTNAKSCVYTDILGIQEAYGKGEVDRCPVGRNTVGYKIGTQNDLHSFCLRRWKHTAQSNRLTNAIAKMSGLNGQMAFDGEDIEALDTVRREEND